MKIKMDNQNRIIMPKIIRDTINVKATDQLNIECENDKIVISKFNALPTKKDIKEMINKMNLLETTDDYKDGFIDALKWVLGEFKK